jgi:hypothetical protein
MANFGDEFREFRNFGGNFGDRWQFTISVTVHLLKIRISFR